MDQRRDQLAHWAATMVRQQTGLNATSHLETVSGDASFRRYFRLKYATDDQTLSWIAVDAPADKEDNPRFVRIANAWHSHQVAVPQVLAQDFEQGFMLLEDFGDQLLWPALHASTVTTTTITKLYQQAIDQLLHIQQLPEQVLPGYDQSLLDQEMELFRDWLCQQQLGMVLSADEQKMLDQVFGLLRDSALAQPQVVVHRDFHSRNLMITADNRLGVIDFQDAVMGAASYDLVSLLRDCYVRWPDELVEALARDYWQKACDAGIYRKEWPQFLQDFDWMGMQRHLKAAGIFARLNLRDGKQGYLADIPNTCRYLVEISGRYNQFAEFHQWLKTRFLPELDRSAVISAAAEGADV